jgi:hypothetical protein
VSPSETNDSAAESSYRSYLLPIIVVGLIIALVAAFVLARQPGTPSASGTAATPVTPRTPLQILQQNVRYGAGITTPVRSPVPSLDKPLGDVWHVISASPARIAVLPTGSISRWFELSAVVSSKQQGGQLELLTSLGKRAIATVATSPAYTVVNFGPLRVSGVGTLPIALYAIPARRGARAPQLVVSPPQAIYLAPGQAVSRMPALNALGSSDFSGEPIAEGGVASFRVTPGVRGRVQVVVTGETSAGSLSIAATLGTTTHSGVIGATPATLALGPFPAGGANIVLRIGRAVGHSGNAELILKNMHLARTG